MWDTFHRSWIYSLFAIAIVVMSVSCSGNKTTLRGLLKDMAENCLYGPKRQQASPDQDGNDELAADVVVECADPPARIVYGT